MKKQKKSDKYSETNIYHFLSLSVYGHFIFNNSTSNIKPAFGGMIPPAPCEP
jgi:hypothetical protein